MTTKFLDAAKEIQANVARFDASLESRLGVCGTVIQDLSNDV